MPLLWLHVIQYAGFFAAQLTNSVLIYLIITKAGKLFGSYRHVMCVFACLYCGSFALVISLLAAQFYYRYVAMCRQDTLAKINGWRLILIFIPCLICFILWFLFVYYGMANTVDKQEYMREELKFYYDEDSTKIPFIAPMYWSIGKKRRKDLEVLGVHVVVCFSIILYCAYNIYTSMKKSQGHMSARTLELNRQLFITLLFQTLLPFVMMYSPVGLLIVLPIFEVYVAGVANFVGASLAVYPSLEPMIAMFCIKEFRRTVLCQKKRRIQCTNNQSLVTSSMHNTQHT